MSKFNKLADHIAIKEKLSKEEAAAIAATAGRAKYGEAKMEKKAEAGKHKSKN